MPNKAALDALVAIGFCALVFAAGWLVRGWKEDSSRLTEERAASAALLASMDSFGAAAQGTLTALQEAKGHQTIIRKEIVREVEKYRDRPCLDAGALGVLQQAALGGSPDGAAGEVPAVPDGTH